MFYWNPLAPETQFFFNDKDDETGEVFTVILYDIEKKERVKEYRYADTPLGMEKLRLMVLLGLDLIMVDWQG